MRLLRYAGPDGPRWGRLEGEQIVPLTAAPWAGGRAGPGRLPLGGARLLAPVEPSKVLCVGLNYQEHRADEQGPDTLIAGIVARNLQDAPPKKDPILFLKAPSSIVAPGEPILLPAGIGRVDFEAELTIVLGARLYRPRTRQEAAAAIFGYTTANDVSARELQERDVQWMRAKSYDSFCPVGPWVETDFDPADRRIQGLLNGEVRQDTSTRWLIADPVQLVFFAAQAMTLLPGDIFLTGTPSGLGPLQPGDVFTARVEGLGDLTNPVRALGA